MSARDETSPEFSMHGWREELTEQAGSGPLTHQSLFLGRSLCDWLQPWPEGLKFKDSAVFYYADWQVDRIVWSSQRDTFNAGSVC